MVPRIHQPTQNAGNTGMYVCMYVCMSITPTSPITLVINPSFINPLFLIVYDAPYPTPLIHHSSTIISTSSSCCRCPKATCSCAPFR